MNDLYTYVQGVELALLDPTRARKAAAILRAAGTPVTRDGYMTVRAIEVLASFTEDGAAAYDAAERAMEQEERQREQNEEGFVLPRDSRISSRSVARRAARELTRRPAKNADAA